MARSLRPSTFRLLSQPAAILLLAVASHCLPSPALGADDLMSPEAAARIGMVESWRQQLNLIGGAASAVDICLHIDGSRERHLVEVTQLKDGKEVVLNRTDVNQLDKFGKPIGLEEARRLASLQVMRWKRRGIEATLKENKIRQVRVYTLGKDGTVEARDAETGELLWLSRNGDPYLPSGPLGVDDQYVTFVNGSTLYQLSAETGKTVREIAVRGTPLLGSMIAGRYALVPTIKGGIEGFPLYDSNEDPFLEMVAGRATADPVSAPGNTHSAWPTDAGYVYVMETEGRPSVSFRFDTDGVVSSELAAAEGGRFFFGSENGHVYGIRATRAGSVLWRYSVGQPIYSTAFVSKDMLLVASVYKNLYALELATGASLWGGPVSQIDVVIGSNDKNIYARTSSNRLTVIGAKTGARIADVSDINVEHYVINRLTDRLYLVGAGGMLQCLRPADSPLPQFKVATEPSTAPADSADTAEADDEPAPARAVDPFAAGADPFGNKAGGAAVDPFAPAGEAADPFAPAGEAADPFGGDPFNN